MDSGRRRSEHDELEQASSDQLAFLRRMRVHALMRLSRLRRDSDSPSSPSAFGAAEGDDDSRMRLK
jgi:hypothetical protein